MDVLPVVAHAAETVRPLVEERRHDLTLSLSEVPMRVVGDPTRLEQIVVNLLVNAAKYTDPGGKIDLAARPEGDEVAISVTDNGRGIPPEQLPRMFELFAQGDRSVERSEGGLGIGLTLVKSLVELHGGVVFARSDGPGSGSQFMVRLPAAPQPINEGAADQPPATSEGERGARVLIVDDNVDSAHGLAGLLGLLGHDVAEAFDGAEAIEAARRHRPEFVLLDIGLPGMNGYEVARRLRAEGFSDATIVAVSGYGEEVARSRAREAGFDHHLVKPVDFEKLAAIMRREP
jgi:CheY-like chemotaxis protein